MKHLRPNAIDYPERYLGSVLGRINVHAKRALAEWRIHNLDDGFRDSANVGVVGHDSGERLLNFLTVTFIGSCFVLRFSLLGGGHAGMREVVGAFGKGARHNNRGFYAPQRQFATSATGRQTARRLSHLRFLHPC